MRKSSSAVEVAGFGRGPIARDVADAAKYALRTLRCPGLGATFCAIGAAESARLNRKWRSHRGPADVLSFAFPADSPGGGLGEVFLCLPLIARRARRLGLSPRRWTRELAVHGLLHLMGFHHGEPEAGQLMGAVQRVIVTRGRRA